MWWCRKKSGGNGNGKGGAEAVDRMMELLMRKSEVDGYKVSVGFATAWMGRSGNKIVAALKGVRKEIDDRMLPPFL